MALCIVLHADAHRSRPNSMNYAQASQSMFGTAARQSDENVDLPHMTQAAEHSYPELHHGKLAPPSVGYTLLSCLVTFSIKRACGRNSHY